MKLASLMLTAGMVLFTGFSQAATTINFEQIPANTNPLLNFSPILDFYNGGAGPNYGISFSPSVSGLVNDGLGTGSNFEYFSNAPSGTAVMYDFDGSSFMNVAIGFVGGASFGYSSDVAATGAVKIWSGLGGTGTELASFDLLGNSATGCTVAGPYCNFNVLSAAFSGVAYSMTFGGNAGMVLFDDITVTAVPEASTWLTMLAGLGAIGFMRRRASK
jgi:MYXO-CTERM domain-containing protein